LNRLRDFIPGPVSIPGRFFMVVFASTLRVWLRHFQKGCLLAPQAGVPWHSPRVSEAAAFQE